MPGSSRLPAARTAPARSAGGRTLHGPRGRQRTVLLRVDALSTSTDLDLDAVPRRSAHRRPAAARRQPPRLARPVHRGAWLGADGGVARYRLRLEPALALLALRRDSYIFQDKNARDIVTELLADYPQVASISTSRRSCRSAPSAPSTARAISIFCPLLASEGLNWRFEHGRRWRRAAPARHLRQQGARRRPRRGTTHPLPRRARHRARRRHRRLQRAPQAAGQQREHQQLGPGRNCWRRGEQRSHLDAGDLPPLPIYDGSGERIASDADAPTRTAN
jgi:type VI secretion system secreted protein VgrG